MAVLKSIRAASMMMARAVTVARALGGSVTGGAAVAVNSVRAAMITIPKVKTLFTTAKQGQ